MTTQMQERESTFTTLSGKTFATYCFVYRINDSYSVSELSKFHSKHQLLFQKIEERNHQLNLMFVDSVFTNILADVTLEVFLKGISSFNQYSSSKRKIKLVDEKDESQYFKYKFYNFIHMLLYSDIASNTVFNGREFADRVYCLRNSFGDIDYYSIYEQTTLQQKLLDELFLEIDDKKSSISSQEVKLVLRISFPS